MQRKNKQTLGRYNHKHVDMIVHALQREENCRTLAKYFQFTTSWSNSIWKYSYTYCIPSINTKIEWGLCKYATVHTKLLLSPVIQWIEPKWLPLKFLIPWRNAHKPQSSVTEINQWEQCQKKNPQLHYVTIALKKKKKKVPEQRRGK